MIKKVRLNHIYHMLIRGLIAIFCYGLFYTQSIAQSRVYTLNNAVPLMYQPATSSMDHLGSAHFFHDEYTLGRDGFVATNSFNAEYPFINESTGRRFLGIGVHFTERQFGRSDLLKTNRAGLSLSSSIQLAAEHSLSLGIASEYFQRKTSMEGLSTGSQWLASEFRYDQNASLGEAFSQSQINYMSLGAGMVWQWHREDVQKAFVGLSAFHLNRPEEAFFQEGLRVPMDIYVQAGMVLYDGQRIRVQPQLYYNYSNGQDAWRTIWVTSIAFSNSNPYDIIQSGSIDLLMDYGFSRDASVGLRFNQPGFSVGFAYQFPIVNKQEAYLENGFELGITISRLFWKKKPKRVIIQSATQRRDFDFGSRDTSPAPRQESEMDMVRNKLEELDGVRSLQFELEKDFKFVFGKADLESGANGFLEELSVMLAEHPDFMLKVEGHTDNIGKPQDNYQLSLDRAQVVAERLVTLGVDQNRIETTGMGDTEPIADNTTEEGRSKNRRVTFIISVER